MVSPAPSDGEVLGHYRLIEQIGAGGMGVVFRARDERLRRDVALKILPTDLFTDEASRRQFRNEALAVGKLNHPNIAMAFDFGHANGVDYLVTEYVPGVTLDERIAGQPLPEKAVVELGMQLASGLEAAHRGGVIHRDLKPQNIRLNQDGLLKILDFGLAQRTLPIEETEETVVLATGPALSGTLPYMAPEVLRGEPTDARSDIWAAGAVLYEMATGKRAYPDRQQTLVVDAILHYDPVRPCLINPKLSQALESVILKALDRDPERRYQSAKELRVDLARIAAGEAVTASTLRTEEVRAAVRRRRLRWILILGAVLLAGIAVGFLIHIWAPPPGIPQKIMAVLPFETVGQDPQTNALGLGLTETLTTKLVQASNSDAIQVVSPRDLRDQGVKTAEDARREFGTDYVLESSLQRAGNTIRVNSSLVDSKTHRQIAARTITVDASDTFGLQDQVVSETLDMLPVRIKAQERQALLARRDTKPEAYEAYIRGRGYLEALSKPEDIDSAIAEFNKAVTIDPNYALGYAALGNAYRLGFQEFSKGNDWIAKASHNCQKALSLNPSLVEGHVCLGHVFRSTGKYEIAVEEFQRALQSEPGSAESLQGLAAAYMKMGNLAAAEDTYKRAISARPNYWSAYEALGNFYYTQGHYSEAAEMFRKATELAPENYAQYSNLGGTYVAQGRYAEAIAAFQRALALRPSAAAYANLGYTYFLMHRWDDAVTTLESVKPAEREWQNWGNLADALYWAPNRRTESAAAYQKAIALALSRLDVNPQDGLVLAYLANYYAMLDNRPGAMSYLQRALEAAPSDAEVVFRAALVYNHFHDTEQALAFLKKAADAHYSRYIIHDTPDFANLHGDARFPTDGVGG